MFLNARGPCNLCLKFTFLKEISPLLGLDGCGQSSSSQDASFTRYVYSITLSTGIIWNTYDISWVSIRGSYLWLFRDCKWNVLLLCSAEHPRSQHPQRVEVGVRWGLGWFENLFIIFNTFTHDYFLQFFIKVKKYWLHFSIVSILWAKEVFSFEGILRILSLILTWLSFADLAKLNFKNSFIHIKQLADN